MGATRGSLGEDDADCSGTPLLAASGSESVYPNVVVANPGSTVYVEDLSQPLTRLVTLSSLQGTEEGGRVGASCALSSDENNVRPALPVVDLNSHFRPPFILR